VIKKLALTLAAIAAGFLGAVVVTSPAQAAPTCPFDMICWFDRHDWQGAVYVVNPDNFPQATCFNMGTDPNTGINWNDIVDSVWWNDIEFASSYVEFYEGPNCTISAVTRAHAWVPVTDQMQQCTEGPSPDPWKGPCGPPNNVAKRISSWAFRL